MPRARLTTIAVLGAAIWAAFAGVAAGAEGPTGVTWTANVNDRNVKAADDTATLVPTEPARITVRIENRSAVAVTVPYVRLHGSVLGLGLYIFTTRVDMEAPAGGTDDREFSIDMIGLGDQASGLIPSRFSLLDAEGEEIAGENLDVEVQGRFTSVYGVFGMAVAAVTLVLLAGGLWRLATGKLPTNRWRRALTLAAPGLGLGFVLTFTLSALGIASPVGALWSVLLLVGGALGFAAGYLSPTPGRDGTEPADDDRSDDGGPDGRYDERGRYTDTSDDPDSLIAPPGIGTQHPADS